MAHTQQNLTQVPPPPLSPGATTSEIYDLLRDIYQLERSFLKRLSSTSEFIQLTKIDLVQSVAYQTCSENVSEEHEKIFFPRKS